MRRVHLVGLLLAAGIALAACAEVMNSLESITPEDSVAGKAVRGANRLRKSQEDLDPAEEHFIGRSVAAQILAMPEYAVADDQKLTEYLNLLGNGIAMSCDEVRHTFAGYRFAVLDTDEVNAFACPGGTILVSRGLIAKTTDEDELAAVVAHEIAHVHHRHGLAAISQANLMEAFTYLGSAGAQAALKNEDLQKVTGLFESSVGNVVDALVKGGYSREAEYQADASGRRFLAAAGYREDALQAVLERMGEAGGEGGMFSTHPAPADRLSHLQPPAAAPRQATDVAAAQARAQRYALAVRP